MIVVRVLLFPLKLVLGLMGISLKVGYKAGKAPFVVSARASKLVGLKGFFFFALGAAAGYLVGSSSSGGTATLGKLVRRGEPPSDDELAEKVKFELSHAPRTWHLPQPEVTVVSGRVELSGSVPDEEARQEFARVAATVPGVVAVENRLTVGDGAAESQSTVKEGSAEGSEGAS